MKGFPILNKYVKPAGSKWFPGYDQQPVCIFEEFDNCFSPGLCLQIADGDELLVESKGNL